MLKAMEWGAGEVLKRGKIKGGPSYDLGKTYLCQPRMIHILTYLRIQFEPWDRSIS